MLLWQKLSQCGTCECNMVTGSGYTTYGICCHGDLKHTSVTSLQSLVQAWVKITVMRIYIILVK
jgi:hypothetical protein